MPDLTGIAIRLYQKYVGELKGPPPEEEYRILLTGDQAVAIAEAAVCESVVLGGDKNLERSWHDQIESHGSNVYNLPLTSITTNGARQAVASATGLSLAGKRVATFITGQNIGAVQDQLFSVSGRHLPLVIHLTNIAMSGHAVAPGSGHEGFHLSCDAGFFTLFAANVQQVADFTFIARRIAETALVPGLVVMDAGETAASLQDVAILNPGQIRQFIGHGAGEIAVQGEAQKLLFGETRLAVPRWHDVDRPAVSGALFDSKSYSLGASGKSIYFDDALGEIIEQVFDEFARLSGRQYHCVSQYRARKARTLFIVQGSAAETAATVSNLNQEVGVISLTCLRPFPDQLLTQYLEGKSDVVVLERVLPATGSETPLLREVRQSLERVAEKFGSDPGTMKLPLLHSVTYGIGGAPLRPADLALVTGRLAKEKPVRFHLGLDFNSDSAHPKRQVLLDRLMRNYPGLEHAGLRASGELPDLNHGETISICVHRCQGSGHEHLVSEIAGILYGVNQGAVRARQWSPGGIWGEQGADFLLHCATSIPGPYIPGMYSPGNDEALDIICLSTDDRGRVKPIEPAAVHLLREGGVILVPGLDEEQLSGIFGSTLRDEVVSRSLRIYAAPVPDLGLSSENEETTLGAIFGAMITSGLVSAKERKIFSAREEALRAANNTDRDARLNWFKNGYSGIEQIDLLRLPMVDVVEAEETTPFALQHLGARDDQYDSLPRLWDQTGVLYRDNETEKLIAEPFLASGTMPPLSAIFRDFSKERIRIPQIDADKCVGCGKCWTSCPDSSLAPVVISPAALIDHGIKLTGADSLRQLAKQLAARISSQARKQTLGSNTGIVLHAAYDWLIEKLDLTPERQEAVEEALQAVCSEIGILPICVTDEFFQGAETVSKDSGELLSLVVNPDTCKDCGLCELVCDAEAIFCIPQTEFDLNNARQAWRAWSKTPDTSSETIERISESSETDTLAALNLSRYCLLSMTGGDGAEPGSGEKIAMRMILSATEFQQQPVLKRFADQIAGSREELIGEIHKLLAIHLKDEDLDLLGSSVDNISTPLVELSALAKNVESAVDTNPVDATKLNRLLDFANRLTDLHWRLTTGRQGLGRARFGLAITPGSVANWAAEFPYNSFQVPVTIDFSNETSHLAAGLLEGHIRDTCETISLLRQARLEIDQPAGMAFTRESLSHLTWKDLDPLEQQICPPMLVIGNEESLGGEGLSQMLWALNSDLPIKIISLSNLDLGSQFLNQQDSKANTGLLAITCRSAFVAQTSIADSEHMFSSVTQAIRFQGPALIRLYSPSPKHHGFETNRVLEQAERAIRSRAFPLYTYNPDKEGVHGSRLELSGNENPSGRWSDQDHPYTLAEWAAGEARFAHHFSPMTGPDANAVELHKFIELDEKSRKGKCAFIRVDTENEISELLVDEILIRATQMAIDTWQLLQELSGLVTPFTSLVEQEVRQQVQAEHEAEIDVIREEYERKISEMGDSIQTDVAARVRNQLIHLVNSGPSRSQ